MSEVKLFDIEEFAPYKTRWNSRIKTITDRTGYYDGSVYTQHRKSLLPSLYNKIKPLYLPLSRAVDVDAGIIPAAWAFPDDTPEALIEARDALFAASKWDTRGVLYVHYGAQSGLTGLRVYDLRQQNKIVLSPLDPATFMVVKNGPFGETEMAFVIEERTGDDGEPYEYAEVITPENIRTYNDGVPFALDKENGMDEEFANANKFVPIVERPHMENGKPLSEATFEKAIPILDEVNQMASWLAKAIKNNTMPQWIGYGMEPSELTHSGDMMWFAPDPNSKVEALVPKVVVSDILEFVKEIAKNATDALPELAFDELRSKSQIATETVELQLIELVLKIKRNRPNYDSGIVEATEMAGRIAKTWEGGEESIKTLIPLENDELKLDAERPILPVDPATAMELEAQALALEREKSLDIQEDPEE